MKISLLCFDLSDNSFGRAALLAHALSKNYEVELIGPAKRGKIWTPMENIKLPVKIFPWKRYPGFIGITQKMLKEMSGDLLFACKARPTSFGIGLLKKKLAQKPLIVDIDDWELGFFYHTDFWGKVGRFLNLSNPNGLPYTWLMERFISHADGVTVSNRFLQNRFGGELIYHCRDTSILSPEKFDPAKSKRKLGLEGKKVLMFLGTPRGHKGIDDLFIAMEKIKDRGVHLAIIGSGDTTSLREKSKKFPGRVSVFSTIPFDELPETLSAADIIAVPQRRTSDTVGQMPAKIFDAMAMAKPIISTRVSDIPEVLNDCGYLMEPGNTQDLAETVDYILSHEDEARRKGERARERCVELYDIQIMGEKLADLVEKTVRKEKKRG